MYFTGKYSIPSRSEHKLETIFAKQFFVYNALTERFIVMVYYSKTGYSVLSIMFLDRKKEK